MGIDDLLRISFYDGRICSADPFIVLRGIIMKKKDIVDLIRYHSEKNENAFREQAYKLAREFDMSGDYQLAEYIMALMSDVNVLCPQNIDNEMTFIEKVDIDNNALFLPDEISRDFLGIANAINRKAEVNKFLFVGEPGTGKTEAVKQMARILERDLYFVNFTAIIDSKLGQTQKNIELLFEEINAFPYLDKVIFMFDEIDALALDRVNTRDLREMGRATSTILKEFDSMVGRAIIFATTNLFDSLDKALVRRFDYTVNFNKYSREDLEKIGEEFLDLYLKKEGGLEKNKRLFKKIIAQCSELPLPGELKNMIKTSVLFSNIDDKNDYLKRLYNAFVGEIPKEICELQSKGFTLREIEALTGISRSSISRELNTV